MGDRVTTENGQIVAVHGDWSDPRGPWVRDHAVYCDGVRMAYALHANARDGEVRLLVMDSSGSPARRGTSYLTRTAKGDVTIRRIPSLVEAV